ncbi:MAG TPA: hypothetical protein VGE01_03845 [Fimbriimonas sp.]
MDVFVTGFWLRRDARVPDRLPRPLVNQLRRLGLVRPSNAPPARQEADESEVRENL